jgi:phosphohistidine phosphatase
MMRTLYLLRHAQSAEKQIGQTDKERELTNMGMKDALLIADYIQKNHLLIDIIVSSTAVRAKTTSMLIVDGLKLDIEKIIEDEELYEASTRTFLELIGRLDDSYNHIMCVGHNPVISYLAEYLTKAEIGDMYTAGLVIIKFKLNSWKDVSQGSGKLENYIYPEMLYFNN